MRRLIYVTILVILIGSLGVPSVVGAQGGRRHVHVILQADVQPILWSRTLSRSVGPSNSSTATYRLWRQPFPLTG